MIKRIFRGLDRVENIFLGIGVAIIGIMMTLVVIEVFTRFLFNYSFSWAMEYESYMLLYLPFLGAAWLLREGGHVTVDILEEYLPKRILHIMDYFVVFVGIVVSLVLTIYGVRVTMDLFVNNVKSLTVAQTPLGYVAMIIPLGSVLLLLEFIRKGYSLLFTSHEETE